MRIVVLIPWRAGELRRERNYAIVRPYLQELGWEIFEGDADGPWSRARAVNAAAQAAGDWDAALISDADTVGDPERFDVAVKLATARAGAIRPHDQLWMLSPEQTADFATFGPENVILTFKTPRNRGGGLLVVSRAAWDAVGGYDERFVTWGHEDSDLNTRLLVDADWDRIPGNAWHLWHPRDTTRTTQTIENRSRMRQTQARYAAEIARVSEARGWDVGSYL